MAADQEVRRRRLQWRARRGTRELDVMLGYWLAEHFDKATEQQRDAFESMLEVQDPELWAWLDGGSEAPRADWRDIIDAIRAGHRI